MIMIFNDEHLMMMDRDNCTYFLNGKCNCPNKASGADEELNCDPENEEDCDEFEEAEIMETRRAI